MNGPRWRFLAPAVVLGAWLGLALVWTHGLQAFTSFSATRLSAGPVPRAAPPLEVVDQTGARWDIARPGPEYRLVQAMYLRCPDVCTVAMARLGRLAHELADLEPDRLRVVSMSMDHDAPDALMRMWQAHGGQAGWSLAALTADPVEPTLARLGVYMFRRRDGLINHSVDIFLIDPVGRVVRDFSADDDLGTVAAAVRSEIR